MGVVANIGKDKFPKQSEIVGAKVSVCFNYDVKNTISGKVVRDDIEEPYRMIILLEDGRFVMSTECQYSIG